MRDLEGAQQALVEQHVRRKPSDVFTIHQHLSMCWVKNARNHIEKRGFSSAVWTDKPGDLAAFNRQGRAINGAESTEVFVKVVDLDHVDFPLRLSGGSLGPGRRFVLEKARASLPAPLQIIGIAPDQRYFTVVILPPSITTCR